MLWVFIVRITLESLLTLWHNWLSELRRNEGKLTGSGNKGPVLKKLSKDISGCGRVWPANHVRAM